MTEPPIDTMAAVRRLRDAGLDERQAEAITETVRDGINGGVATRADSTGSESSLRGDVARLETVLTNRIHAVAGAIIAGQIATAGVMIGFLSP